MKKSRRILIFGWVALMLLLLILFISYWQSRKVQLIEHQLQELSIIIRDALWIVDSKAPVQYLKLAAVHSSFESITVHLDSVRERQAEPFLIVEGPVLNRFEQFIVSTGLITRNHYDVPVFYDDKKIGRFSVVHLNKNIYIYMNAILVVLFCSLVFIYFYSTVEAKALLEKRVSDRTRELRESEKMYRTLVANIPGVSFRSLYDNYCTMKLISDEIERISGYPAADFINNEKRSFASVIFEEDLDHYLETIRSAVGKGKAYSIQYRINSQFDSVHWVLERGQGVYDIKGDVRYIDGVMIDITEQKLGEEEKASLREHLNHKSRMDALGQLASGMAHDFNNVLCGIINAAQLLQMPQNKLSDHALIYVDIIFKASSRASELIAKLLTYGRKGKAVQTTIDINKIIEDTLDILTSTIDKKIRIVYNSGARNPISTGNNSSIESALLNLGINASHAMPTGGILEISTNNIELSETYCKASYFDIAPGEYIDIEIRDSGTGIQMENLQKIFEPFFTTKEQGTGTGLGLFAVYGTVLEHHGAIQVYSEVGTGTVFKIQLPCVVEDRKEQIREKSIIRGSGTILLVDDEEIIRFTGQSILEDMGYEVLTASNGNEAVKIFAENHMKIDLVLLDMIMPEMDGREAFAAIREINGEAKIVLASGFTRDEHLKELNSSGLNGFIRKPFNAYELSHLLSEVLSV